MYGILAGRQSSTVQVTAMNGRSLFVPDCQRAGKPNLLLKEARGITERMQKGARWSVILDQTSWQLRAVMTSDDSVD